MHNKKENIPDNVCHLQLCIGDATSATWCNMFDATSLFHKSPQELIQMKENSYDDFKVIHTLESVQSTLKSACFFSRFEQYSIFLNKFYCFFLLNTDRCLNWYSYSRRSRQMSSSA